MRELGSLDHTRHQQLDWVDFAKGLCMVLVVLFHSGQFMETQINNGYEGFWWPVNLSLSPLRMPLFFFVSGMLYAGAIHRPLSQTRARTVGLYYVYLIWALIFLLRLYLPQARDEGEAAPQLWEVVLSLVLPTSFWYLYALPAFFLLSWLLVRTLKRHSVWALIPLALLSAVSILIDPFTETILAPPLDSLKVPSLATHFVWFFLGLHGKDMWGRLMTRASYQRLVMSAAVYVALYLVTFTFGLQLLLNVPLSVLALFLMVQVTALVRMDLGPAVLLRRIGKQTLPVYIGHIFLISIVSAVFKA
jgi:uncharacterized membrane protein YcfT